MWSSRAGIIFSILLAIAFAKAHAQPALHAPSPFASPIRTDLGVTDPSYLNRQENITVFGKRPAFRNAPAAQYGEARAPWEMGKAIHDTMTGANTALFGNAYNLGSLLGSDERSNETGGQYLAPRHQ